MDALRKEESATPPVIPAGIPQPRSDADSSHDSAESSEPSGQAHLHDSAESRSREDFAQRRVDALSMVAEAALGKGLGQTERGEPYQVMIHVDSDILADRSHGARADLDNGEGISAESCRRLACDARHVAVTQDKQGNILNIGCKARKISKPLWRALSSRDRTCRFPGCDRTQRLQAHHIEHGPKGARRIRRIS